MFLHVMPIKLMCTQNDVPRKRAVYIIVSTIIRLSQSTVARGSSQVNTMHAALDMHPVQGSSVLLKVPCDVNTGNLKQTKCLPSSFITQTLQVWHSWYKNTGFPASNSKDKD